MEKQKYIPADIHMHSTLSPDGNDTPVRMAARACGLGIKYFTLTDHIESEKPESWDYAGAIAQSYPTYLEIKRLYGDKMTVFYGAELGQPLYNLPLAERVLSEHDYDFVLGSQHRTKSYPRLDQVPDTDADRTRCLDEYFEELLALAQWGRFCSLSHLTFPLRFILREGVSVDMTRYDSIIDRILDTIIAKDIALEVNSSGIRKGLGVPMPSAEYVKRYYDKGGRMITTGSDAHYERDVGADLPQCYDMLREIGFKQVTVFSKRKPVFITI